MSLVHWVLPPGGATCSFATSILLSVFLIPLSFLAGGCRQRLLVPGPPTYFSDADSIKLKRITRRYLELAWALDPELALAGSLPGFEGTLSHREWLERVFTAPREVRHLRAELGRVKERGLTGRERVDRHILAGYLAALAADLEVRRPWRQDPGFYLDKVEAALARSRRIDNQTARCESFRLRLEEVPRLLAAGERNLENPSPLLLRAAAARAEELARQLARQECCPRPYQCCLRERLQAGAEAAARSLRAHARRLRDYTGPTRRGGWQLGEGRLGRMLRSGAGLDLAPATLLEQLEEDRLQLRRVLEKAPERGRSDGEGVPLRAVGTPLAAARAWCLEAGILPLGLFPPPTAGTEGWIDAVVSSLDPGESLRLAREGYPGREAFLEALRLAGEGSLLRRGHPCLLLLEGWCSYAEDLWTEGLARPELAAQRDRNRLAECCRARLALALHLGRVTLDEGVAELERELGLPATEALVTAATLARRPLAALGWIGGKFIHRLRRQVEAGRGGAFLPALFHRRLLLAGPVPLSRMEAVLRGESTG